ncbi:MAG: helix-turn-helix transcriptional regulator [Bacteroidetes bacterium]|nr:helix-turn-helix transcriptional regulator [Bacteroidota bacterium]HET6243572.1 helix-turn-helix transcriptional regulator [Bacteroidia bacterium]
MHNFSSRLKEFIEYKGLSFTKFGKKIECSASQMTQMITYKKNFGIDKLMKISNVFPELNSEWLLTGNGNMLKDIPIEDTTLDNNPPVNIPPLATGFKLDSNVRNSNELLILKLNKEIRFLKTIINTVKSQIKEKEELITMMKNNLN